MAKGLTIMAVVIAILLLIVFGLDLAIGVPFRKASVLMDIGFIVCALGLGLLSWSAFRELK